MSGKKRDLMKMKELMTMCFLLGISILVMMVCFRWSLPAFGFVVFTLLIGTHLLTAVCIAGTPESISEYKAGTVFKVEGPATCGNNSTRIIVPMRKVEVSQNRKYSHKFEIINKQKNAIRLIDVGQYFHGKPGDYFVYELLQNEEPDLYEPDYELTQITLDLTEEKGGTA